MNSKKRECELNDRCFTKRLKTISNFSSVLNNSNNNNNLIDNQNNQNNQNNNNNTINKLPSLKISLNNNIENKENQINQDNNSNINNKINKNVPLLKIDLNIIKNSTTKLKSENNKTNINNNNNNNSNNNNNNNSNQNTLNNNQNNINKDVQVKEEVEDNIGSMVERDIIKGYRNMCSRINNRLYISGGEYSKNSEVLTKDGITHILNVSDTYKNLFLNKFNYLHIRIKDKKSVNIASYFPNAISFFEDALNVNGRILIHCCAGISRSVAFGCLLLMYSIGCTFSESLRMIKLHREFAEPNIGFQLSLLEWEKDNITHQSSSLSNTIAPLQNQTVTNTNINSSIITSITTTTTTTTTTATSSSSSRISSNAHASDSSEIVPNTPRK